MVRSIMQTEFVLWSRSKFQNKINHFWSCRNIWLGLLCQMDMDPNFHWGILAMPIWRPTHIRLKVWPTSSLPCGHLLMTLVLSSPIWVSSIGSNVAKIKHYKESLNNWRKKLLSIIFRTAGQKKKIGFLSLTNLQPGNQFDGLKK